MAQTTQPIAEAGEGERTELSGLGDCQDLNNPQLQGFCDYVFEGSVAGSPITNGSGELEGFESAGLVGGIRVDFNQATYTPTTYSDAPTTGSFELQEPREEGGDQIDLYLEGTSSGKRDRTGTTTFNGRFTVTGGTGRYEGASGEGTFKTDTLATRADKGRFTASFDGTLILPDPDSCTITGTSEDDVLTGTAGRDVICGLGGSDTIRGFGGNDLIKGGDGNDTIRGNVGNDTIRGGDGRDSLQGNEGDDTMYGHSGSDTMQGGAGNDTMYGGTQRDSVRGQAGTDEVHGGPGDDTITQD
jgi:Ca2+-binding RTX toxin-like protein